MRGHTGVSVNGLADTLAKEATLIQDTTFIRLCPLPLSFLKYCIKKKFRELVTIKNKNGRYNIFAKISEDTLIHHQNLYIFMTKHGQFTAYLYKFGRVLPPLRVSGEHATFLHYSRECSLTPSVPHQKANKNYRFTMFFICFIKRSSIWEDDAYSTWQK